MENIYDDREVIRSKWDEIEGNKLHILIEKDFKCLSPAREGKENEMFENPATEC